MRNQLLDTREDLDWLFETHLKDVPAEIRGRTLIAHVYGNEDSPELVKLYDRDQFDAEPIHLWPPPAYATHEEAAAAASDANQTGMDPDPETGEDMVAVPVEVGGVWLVRAEPYR